MGHQVLQVSHRLECCNLCVQVCLGVWQATSAQDIIGKIVGIFFPIMAFVAIGAV